MALISYVMRLLEILAKKKEKARKEGSDAEVEHRFWGWWQFWLDSNISTYTTLLTKWSTYEALLITFTS